MVETSFIDSFRAFVRECDVPFTEQGSIFLFPAHKLEVRLLTGENLPDQNPFHYPDILYLYQDRWFASPQVTRERIAARLGKFKSIFARKCKLLTGKEWQQLQKGHPDEKIASEADFLNRYHAYGYAVSKYRYALLWEDEIVAVATFSAPRPMLRQLTNPLRNVPKSQAASLCGLPLPLDPHRTYQPQDAVEFCSYEWVRYVSLPGVRVVGGMGRLLQAFLKEVAHPDNPRFAGMPVEVMSYSDNEWSGGEVYEALGFTLAGEREAVEYYVDKTTYKRFSARKLGERCGLQPPELISGGPIVRLSSDLGTAYDLTGVPAGEKRTAAPMPPSSFPENYYKITNRGSRKYLLQPLLASR